MTEYIVDIDHLIRYYREKYRVCWKEIFIKFYAIVGHQSEPYLCESCNLWFNIPEMAGCKTDKGEIDFHKISGDSRYELMKRHIQIVDGFSS
jgi:hypothetical protein